MRVVKGKPLIHYLEDLQEGEKVATILKVTSFEEQSWVLLCSKRGVVKKSELTVFSHPRRRGIHAIVLDEGDEIMAARLVPPGRALMLFTHQGMGLRFDQERLRPLGRVARGVRGIRLKNPQDHVVACEVVSDDDTLVVVCENGYGKRTQVANFRQIQRGGMGVIAIATTERNGGIVGALKVEEGDGLLMISAQGIVIRIGLEDLRVLGRSAQGVRLAHIKDNDHLIAIERVSAAEEFIVEGDAPAAIEVASAPSNDEP